MENEDRRATILKEIDTTKEWLSVLLVHPPLPPWISEDDERCVRRTIELLDKSRAIFAKPDEPIAP